MRVTNIKFFFLTLILLFGCFKDKSSRYGKEIVKDYTRGEGEVPEVKCTKFVSLTDDSCMPRCPDDTHAGSDAEIAEQMDKLLMASGDDPELEKTLTERIDGVKGVCILDVKRPTNQIMVKSYCGCLGDKPDILNNCAGTCSKRNDATSTLFGTVALGSAIELNEKLGNLYNWCKAENLGDKVTQPECVMEFRNGAYVKQLPLVVSEGQNTFSVDIKELPLNTGLTATILERKSGAKGKPFNIRRFVPKDEEDEAGNLKLMPITQYTCVTRLGSVDNTGEYYKKASLLHFYFAQDSRPSALRPGQNFLVCHDTNTTQRDDNDLYPRIDEVPGQFVLWDQSDTRLYDQNGDKSADINQEISKRLSELTNTTKAVHLFHEFRWPTGPSNPENPDGQSTTSGTGSNANATQAPLLGFYMQAFQNSKTGAHYCPTQDDYKRDEPIFQILKDVVGISTEGLFIAVKEEEMLETSSGKKVPAPQDILFIRESLLKKIWFYHENNKYYTPNEITAGQKTIRFYWPVVGDNPHVQKDSQKLYTIRSASSLSSNQNSGGLRTTIMAPDKRYGCVPMNPPPED